MNTYPKIGAIRYLGGRWEVSQVFGRRFVRAQGPTHNPFTGTPLRRDWIEVPAGSGMAMYIDRMIAPTTDVFHLLDRMDLSRAANGKGQS